MKEKMYFYKKQRVKQTVIVHRIFLQYYYFAFKNVF